jgi:hypothetical protein
VFTVGHAGFLLDPHEKQQLHNLQEQVCNWHCRGLADTDTQITHKAAFIDHIQKVHGIRSVVILTHSIGAWITLQVRPGHKRGLFLLLCSSPSVLICRW